MTSLASIVSERAVAVRAPVPAQVDRKHDEPLFGELPAHLDVPFLRTRCPVGQHHARPLPLDALRLHEQPGDGDRLWLEPLGGESDALVSDPSDRAFDDDHAEDDEEEPHREEDHPCLDAPPATGHLTRTVLPHRLHPGCFLRGRLNGLRGWRHLCRRPLWWLGGALNGRSLRCPARGLRHSGLIAFVAAQVSSCLLYTSPSPRD